MHAQTFFTSDADTSHFNHFLIWSRDWTKTFPKKEIDSRTKVKQAYAEAVSKKYGYRLLQLAAWENDGSFTYGELSPNTIINESYKVAIEKKDPYLLYYLIEFDLNDNIVDSNIETVREREKTLVSMALELKIVTALNWLASLEDARQFMKTMTPNEIRLKALFINNPNHSPYKNPYDYPDPDKKLTNSPLRWADYPFRYIKSTAEMNEACKKAEINHDGYKLLQLANLQLDYPYSTLYSAKQLFQKAFDIALYNKDPYLLAHLLDITLDNKSKNISEPSSLFEKAVEVAIERKDAGALSFLKSYYLSRSNSKIITSAVLTKQIAQAEKVKPLVIWDEFKEGNFVYIKHAGETTIELKSCVKPPVGNVVIPTVVQGLTVASIWAGAFSNCKELTGITIPSGVRTLGKGIFEACPLLKTIRMDGVNPAFKVVNGVLFSADMKQLIRFPAEHVPANGTYTVPATVTSIHTAAFQHCRHLTTMTLSPVLVSIGRDAFNSCINLTAVAFPSSLVEMGNMAFWHCEKLSKVTFASGCKLKEVPDDAFHSCPITSISLPNLLTFIGNRAFYGCNLASVMIPSKVEMIGAEAFYQNKLEMVCFSESLTLMGGDAIDRNNIKTIVSLSNKPFTHFTNDVDTIGCMVYVPFNTADAYKQHSKWKKYQRIEEAAVVNKVVYALSKDKKTVYFKSMLYPGAKQGVLPSTITVNGVVYPVAPVKK